MIDVNVIDVNLRVVGADVVVVAIGSAINNWIYRFETNYSKQQYYI